MPMSQLTTSKFGLQLGLLVNRKMVIVSICMNYIFISFKLISAKKVVADFSPASALTRLSNLT